MILNQANLGERKPEEPAQPPTISGTILIPQKSGRNSGKLRIKRNFTQVLVRYLAGMKLGINLGNWE